MGNQNAFSFGYCFNRMQGEMPSIASTDSPRIEIPSMSSMFEKSSNNSTPEYSMNGNLDEGFNIIDSNKKNKMAPVPKVEAIAQIQKNKKYAIIVTIEIGSSKYKGVVAYAGESEIMTGKEIDQTKVNKIANDSINFLRGTKGETQNITE